MTLSDYTLVFLIPMIGLTSCNKEDSLITQSEHAETEVIASKEKTKVTIYSATISEFKIGPTTLHEAIKHLNKIISKKYPDNKELLIAYISCPFEGSYFNSEPTIIDIHLIKNPPIIEVVKVLATSSGCHFSVRDSQVIMYGWHRPDLMSDYE